MFCPPHQIILDFLSSFLPDMQIPTIETPYPVKDEEENAMHNTVVIFSSNDSFTLKQVFALLYFRKLPWYFPLNCFPQISQFN